MTKRPLFRDWDGKLKITESDSVVNQTTGTYHCPICGVNVGTDTAKRCPSCNPFTVETTFGKGDRGTPVLLFPVPEDNKPFLANINPQDEESK